jgi:Clostripain family
MQCGEHGSCIEGDQGAICECEDGYGGSSCERCAEGLQDNDGDGKCTADCSTAGLECTNATCDDSTGVPGCVCLEGHTGANCEACADGYQDNDDDGVCQPTCETAYPYCGHGKCDDVGGAPLCVCSPTWGGDHCDACADGFQDNDQDGKCESDCATALLTCEHGMCDDTEGEAVCVCDVAYGGEDCSTCGWGYQDNDGDGLCTASCAKAALDCGHGTCRDALGEPACACDDGYQGTACEACQPTHQDNDQDGVCNPSCATLGYECSGVGTCSDVTGVATCSCPVGLYDDGAGNCITAAGFWCVSALELDVWGGGVTGTTTGAGNEHVSSCQFNTGEEVIYTFSVVDPLRLRFHLTGFDSVLYVRTACDAPSTEVACSDDEGPASTAWLEHEFAPGQYYLFVDSFGSEGGEYDLDIDVLCGVGGLYDASAGTCVDDPCEPNPCVGSHASQCDVDLPDAYTCVCDAGWVEGATPGVCEPDPSYDGEGCNDAVTVIPGTGSLTGSTSSVSNDGEGTCGGAGPDRVYTFSIAERMRASFKMTGYDTVLYVRKKCGEFGSQLGCSDDGSGTAAELSVILEPGTYYLFADSAGGSGGNYTLDYEFRPDPCGGDPCPGLPVCMAASDWSAHECVCPTGSLPLGADCVDDPCDPNPCAGGTDHRTKCTPELATAQYTCTCSVGYLEDAGVCVADPAAAEWSFLVFVNADNNLESYGYDDIDEMGAAGSTTSVHVAALFDTAYQDGGDARKITVTQGGYVVEENLGEVDMGDWNTLAEYGVWALNRYPARHYALVLWDHGDGWRQMPTTPPLAFKAFSNDDHGNGNGISVSNGDYAQALGAITDVLGDKLDLVGFDACLMGMWEVAEATAPFAHVLVASEETEPGAGWPYDDFMVPLIQTPETSAIELGSAIVDAYHDESSSNSTLAAVDLDSMADLRTAMSALADGLRTNPGLYASVESNRKSTQTFSYDDYRDLMDFAQRMQAMPGAPAEVVDAATALVGQLETTIIHARAQSSHPRANGMSIYFPKRGGGMDGAYRGEGAVWSVNTTWDDFLESFTQ